MALSAETGQKTSIILFAQHWMEDSLAMIRYKQFRVNARHLQIAVSTSHRIFKLFELTAEVDPQPQPSRPSTGVIDDHHELLIVGLISKSPCLYLSEICHGIYGATIAKVSQAAVCRILKRYGFTRKKARQVARQRCMEF